MGSAVVHVARTKRREHTRKKHLSRHGDVAARSLAPAVDPRRAAPPVYDGRQVWSEKGTGAIEEGRTTVSIVVRSLANPEIETKFGHSFIWLIPDKVIEEMPRVELAT